MSDIAKTMLSALGERATWRQWYMACALTFLYIYAQIDGSSLILMVEPVKRDLGATDTEMSLLLGLSFAAFYAILGLPAGYLVDRMARRPIAPVSATAAAPPSLTFASASVPAARRSASPSAGQAGCRML